MDMAQLATRTGIPVRRLRYAWDHRVLPGLSSEIAGQGIPRTFDDFEGFGIALAAQLLDSGLTRKLVAACLDVACSRPVRSPPKTDPPLLHAYRATASELLIGDGRYLQIRAARRLGIVNGIDTGWMPLTLEFVLPADYVPAVLVRVDLDRLVKSVRDDQSERR